MFDITVNLDGNTIYRNQKRYAARDMLPNGGTGIRPWAHLTQRVSYLPSRNSQTRRRSRYRNRWLR